jgi:GT2 family glycosyltransferase
MMKKGSKNTNNKNVIAVIVTYNRKELLKECITALLNQKYKNCRILVVDNASTDGTKEHIADLLENERVIYKNTGSNLGGAGGFNFGMREAVQLGCDFVWVMDDDCIVHSDTLTTLLEVDKKLNGNYGFLASKVLWKDNSICKMNIPRKTLTKNLTDLNNLQKITMSSFVSFFVKASIIKEVGLPIKEFFIWTDDWEYSRRISRKYDCYFVPNSIVTHK